MHLLRRLLFYFFAAAYIVSCPLLLMYAFGYIFRLNIEKGLVKTGVISFATVPAHATVLLENRRFTSRTPAVIHDLIPGNYKVQLTLQDFFPWSENILVEAGKAVIRDKVFLVPRKWEFEVLFNKPVDRLLPLEGTGFLLLGRGPFLREWMLYDVKKNTFWPLVEPDSAWGNYSVRQVYSVTQSQHLLVRLGADSGVRYLWVSFRDKENKLREVTTLVPEFFDQVQWDPDLPETLFFSKGRLLQKVDLAAGSCDNAFLTNVRGFSLRKRQVYALEDNGAVYQVDYDKKRAEQVPLALTLGLALSASSGGVTLQPLSGNVFFFQGAQGQAYVNLPPYELARQGVRGHVFASETRQLCIWKQDQLGIADLSAMRHASLGGMRREEFSVSWITRGLLPVRQAYFVFEDSHLLFVAGDNVYLLALAGDSFGRICRLFEIKSGSQIAYSPPYGRVYYLGQGSSELRCVELLAQKGL